MTNYEDLKRQFEGPSRRFWAVLGATLAVIVVLGSLAAGPAWLVVKRWQARKFTEEAEAYIGKRELRMAMERARSALQLFPGDLAILRLNARLLGELGSDASLPLWKRIVDRPDASSDDRAAFAEAALVLERPELVSGIMPDFLSEQFLAPRSSRIAAIYHAQAGRRAEAIRHARLAHEAQPANPTNAVLLASILASEVSPEARAESRRLFWTLARTDSPFRTESFRTLIRSDFGTRADREEASTRLGQLATRTAEEEAIWIEARMLLDPSRVSVLASNLIASVPRDDVERLSLAVGVLNRQERHRDVLRLTVGDRGLRSRGLFSAKYAALQATGQPEEAYRHAMHTAAPLPPFALERLRAEAAHAIPDPRRRDSHLAALVRLAEDHPARLRQVGELAEKSGAPNVAIDAWKRLSMLPGEEIGAFRRLQKLFDLRGDTWTARDYARRAQRLGDPDARLPLELAYYSLLLGEDFDRALGEAERQWKARPDEFAVLKVLALAHLRLEAPEKARELLERVYVPDGELQSDGMAVLAAVYGANGLVDRARSMARDIPLARLRPEERDLVRPWLALYPIGGGDSLLGRR